MCVCVTGREGRERKKDGVKEEMEEAIEGKCTQERKEGRMKGGKEGLEKEEYTVMEYDGCDGGKHWSEGRVRKNGVE